MWGSEEIFLLSPFFPNYFMDKINKEIKKELHFSLDMAKVSRLPLIGSNKMIRCLGRNTKSRCRGEKKKTSSGSHKTQPLFVDN